jgi:hypothetical protein
MRCQAAWHNVRLRDISYYRSNCNLVLGQIAAACGFARRKLSPRYLRGTRRESKLCGRLRDARNVATKVRVSIEA